MRRLAPLAASFLGGVVGAVAFLALIGARPAGQAGTSRFGSIIASHLTAHTLTILDPKGNEVGSFIGVTPPGAFLNVGGQSGRSINLVVTSSGSHINVGSDKGKFGIHVLGESAPSVTLSYDGQERVTIGKAKLVTKASGVSEETPAGGIVIFDEVGNVVWKAP